MLRLRVQYDTRYVDDFSVEEKIFFANFFSILESNITTSNKQQVLRNNLREQKKFLGVPCVVRREKSLKKELIASIAGECKGLIGTTNPPVEISEMIASLEEMVVNNAPSLTLLRGILARIKIPGVRALILSQQNHEKTCPSDFSLFRWDQPKTETMLVSEAPPNHDSDSNQADLCACVLS